VLSGCFSSGTANSEDEEKERTSWSDLGSGESKYDNVTWTNVGSVDLAWPMTAADSAPDPKRLDISGNITLLRFSAEFNSNTGGTFVSGNLGMGIIGEELHAVVSFEGGKAVTSLGPGPSLTFAYPNPFALDERTVDVNGTVPQVLLFGARSWGDVTARIQVETGHVAQESPEAA
jgi:hypothetical protein